MPLGARHSGCLAVTLFDFASGDSPLLVNVPHTGVAVPDAIAARLTPAARGLPDTDWFVDRLYRCAHEMGASMQIARLSRYVVDLNRPPDDAAMYPGQAHIGLCPLTTFAGEDIYRAGTAPDRAEQQRRVESYWRPYHDHLAAQLEKIRARHGYAVLWDAHSIRSEVPKLFDGRLPDLNLGTNNGASCAPALADLVAGICASSVNFSSVVDGRFRGGYITRFYGRPDAGCHALQMELAQAAYMDEVAGATFDSSRAASLGALLESLLAAVLGWCEYRGG